MARYLPRGYNESDTDPAAVARRHPRWAGLTLRSDPPLASSARPQNRRTLPRPLHIAPQIAISFPKPRGSRRCSSPCEFAVPHARGRRFRTPPRPSMRPSRGGLGTGALERNFAYREIWLEPSASRLFFSCSTVQLRVAASRGAGHHARSVLALGPHVIQANRVPCRRLRPPGPDIVVVTATRCRFSERRLPRARCPRG